MDNFRFAYPFVWLLLLPITYVIWQSIWGSWKSRPTLMRYSDTRLLHNLPVSLRVRLRHFPNLLRVVALFFLLIALARPQQGTTAINLFGSGVDIVIALDISDSMGTADMGNLSRLDSAKSVIVSLLELRPFDRIGLVAFSEEAFYLSPPTLNHLFVQQALQTVAPATYLGLSSKSAIGTGITTATHLLKNSTATSKIIIVFTDGNNNAGIIDPFTASQVANALGIRVYAIGMGQTGNELDEMTLQRFTSSANGQYFRATSLSDLTSITTTIDLLERTRFNQLFHLQWEDVAFVWIAVATLLLLVERVLRHTIFQAIP